MIDVKTGLSLWAVQALTLAAILLVAGLHRRTSTLILWSIGIAMHAVGVGLVAARGQIPDFLSIEVANAVALTAYAFGVVGLRVKDGKPIPLSCALPTAVWVGAMCVPVIRDTLGYRACVFSLGSAIGSLNLAVCLWQAGFGMLATRRKLAAVFILEAAVHTVSIAMLWRYPATTLQQMSSFPVAALTAATLLILVVLLTFRMIMEESEKHLRNLARLDSLTGALNRRGFFERFETIRHEAEQGGRMMALVLFDLDHFKQINDRHGHAAGDQTLLAFSHIVFERLDPEGAFARLGGEEFAAIFPMDDSAAACAFAESVRRQLAGAAIPIASPGAGRTIGATVSAGICVRIAPAAAADAMLSAADKALYAAKRGGRNRMVLSGPQTAAEMAEAAPAALARADAASDEYRSEPSFKHG